MRLSTKIALIIAATTVSTVIWTIYFTFSSVGISFSTLINTANFFNFERSILYSLLSIIVTISLISLFVWGLIKKILIEPIEYLDKTTKIIAAGNLGIRIKLERNDEIGQLGQNINMITQNIAHAFQGMADSLRETKEKEQALALYVTKLEEAQRATEKALEDLHKEKIILEETNAKDEALLSSLGDGVIAVDAVGKVIFINQEAMNILGIGKSDAIGRFWNEIIVSVDEKTQNIFPPDQEIVRRALLSGVKITTTCLFIRNDRIKIPVSVTASPVTINNTISGVIVIFRDITKEKEIDRMKTEFISLASHQLRTPLSAIRWFSELLTDESSGKLSKEQKELVQNISDSANRMVELVNALLNISRIESGRIIIDPKPTDLVELARQVIKELEVKILEKKQRLVVSAHEQLPKITIDPKLIRQVFLNLLTNAIKYSPEGGEIIVFISRKNDEIIVQVSDNGYGIPVKDQSKIFQKFFRADNIVKVETDGSGLGLYLAKAIVESSQGKIWFQSQEGKGTTFWFSLPLSGTPAKKGEVTIGS